MALIASHKPDRVGRMEIIICDNRKDDGVTTSDDDSDNANDDRQPSYVQMDTEDDIIDILSAERGGATAVVCFELMGNMPSRDEGKLFVSSVVLLHYSRDFPCSGASASPS